MAFSMLYHTICFLYNIYGNSELIDTGNSRLKYIDAKIHKKFKTKDLKIIKKYNRLPVKTGVLNCLIYVLQKVAQKLVSFVNNTDIILCTRQFVLGATHTINAPRFYNSCSKC